MRPPLMIPASPPQQRRLPITLPIITTPLAAPALPSLRRLEWAFEGERSQSGTSGINFLYDILIAAPSLQELVLTGPMPFSAVTTPHENRLLLRALHTLRLHNGAGACWFIAAQTTYWELPVLENVVVEGFGRAGPLRALWKRGEQVRMLELALGGGLGGVSIGDVSKIVAVCPALEELNLQVGVKEYVNRTPMDVDDVTWSCTHDTLQRIGICIDDLDCSVETWVKIVHFVWKFVEGCLALGQVLLYVFDAEVASQNPRFHAFRETLLSSGSQLSVHTVDLT